MRDREKRLASKAKYRRSEKGKATIKAHMEKYRETVASRKALKRYKSKVMRDPKLSKAWKENNKLWLQTPAGIAYTKRHNRELPSFTSESFLESLTLLSTLYKEIQDEYR